MQTKMSNGLGMMKKDARQTAKLPMFRQIVNALKTEILSGNMAEHAALPSERAVAELYEVSRMTARRALEAIETEGLAYSKGRQGRFVSPKRLDYDVSSMANFISGAAAKGIKIEMQLLKSTQIRAEKRLANMLSVPVGTPLYKNYRLFQRAGHATFLETETVVAQRCAELLVDATAQQKEQLPKQRYSPLGHTADIVIRMCAIDRDEAELLGVMPHQAGIEQEQLIRDRTGDAFCFCRQIWRGELAQFSARAILQD